MATNKKMCSIDIMIDLETTGTKPGCGILSIGACSFNEIMIFYQTISPVNCAEIGLVPSADTLDWWAKQPSSVKQEAFSGVTPVVQALGEFADFLQRLHSLYDNVYVWGNGADFDLPILAAAYHHCGMKQPWGAWNGRCYRTLKNLPIFKGILPEPFVGDKHNALADARHQAKHALRLLQVMKGLQERAQD